jgi:DNA-binding HxlR family transcriptional regulator
MKKVSKEVDPRYLACPIRQVVSKFGDKWSLLVLFQLGRSENGVMRFSEIHNQMVDCSQKMLSQTLKSLEQNHLVSRKVYPVVPPKVEYRLTEVGLSLIPNLEGLVAWGLKNFNQFIKN